MTEPICVIRPLFLSQGIKTGQTNPNIKEESTLIKPHRVPCDSTDQGVVSA
jgi:hypothetical protein